MAVPNKFAAEGRLPTCPLAGFPRKESSPGPRLQVARELRRSFPPLLPRAWRAKPATRIPHLREKRWLEIALHWRCARDRARVARKRRARNRGQELFLRKEQFRGR